MADGDAKPSDKPPETPKKAPEPLPVSARMSRYHVPGDDTKVMSSAFRLRRVNRCIVIETLNPRLVQHEEIKSVFHQAVAKPDRIGVIINFPTPNYVTSLFIVALREIAREAKAGGIPFIGVLHPKLRLLLRIFELQDDIPTEDRLDLAIRTMNERWGGEATA